MLFKWVKGWSVDLKKAVGAFVVGTVTFLSFGVGTELACKSDSIFWVFKAFLVLMTIVGAFMTIGAAFVITLVIGEE
jgi:hypothetical protein